MTGGTVVVLGKTGRNFAAGMSGGRAYVLDLDQRLINPEMVDVISIPSDQDQILQKIIEQFQVDTGSLIAKELLSNWQDAKNRISLVMPRDYARVLDVMAKAQREGLPVDSAVMAAING
jgi:glutamate synthase (NADPH/NADH) large chain